MGPCSGAHVGRHQAAGERGQLGRLQLGGAGRRERQRQPQLVAAVQLPRHLPQRSRLQAALLQRVCSRWGHKLSHLEIATTVPAPRRAVEPPANTIPQASAHTARREVLCTLHAREW